MITPKKRGRYGGAADSAPVDPNEIHPTQCSGVKLFVDDLALGRGVVLSRAASTLRSIETQPFDWGFVRTRRACIPSAGSELTVGLIRSERIAQNSQSTGRVYYRKHSVYSGRKKN